MADDELDALYSVRPEDFTGLRTTLAVAAKDRGDAAAAKRISAARKPTTAAWVVNRLARSTDAAQRLTDLGGQLRAAHAALDGDRIRELSAEQRHLVDRLAADAFDAAEVTEPAAGLREDVTGTLQAAIADPDVAARLGRLTKAERWSGFGVFGDTAPVFTVARDAKSKAEPKPAQRKPTSKRPRDDNIDALRQQRETATAALTAAERAKADADDELSAMQAELAAARLRRDRARQGLREAERELGAAEAAYDTADRASRDATDAVRKAKAGLKPSGTPASNESKDG
jgi:hypothetical protein